MAPFVVPTSADLTRETMSVANQVGVVLFDDPHQHTSGWSCLASDGRVRRIVGTESLDTGFQWITNLDYEQMASSGLSGNIRFRDSDYLRVGASDIARAFGVGSDEHAHAAEVAAGVASRVLRYAEALGHLPDAGDRTLRSGLRKVAGACDPALPEHIAGLFEQAVCSYTTCEQTPGYDRSCTTTFVVPPLVMARRIASLSIFPAMNESLWRNVGRRMMPGDGEVEAWLAGIKRPTLLRINASEIDPDMNAVINFGSMSRSRVPARWVPHTEAAMLARIARVRILDAIESENPPERLPRYVVDQVESVDDDFVLSYSLGLYLDSLMLAPATAHKAPPYALRGGLKSAPVIAPFLRAEDRMACLEYALRLRESGFMIAGYGAGRIRAVPRRRIDADDVAAICIEHGLLCNAQGASGNSSARHRARQTALGVAQDITLYGTTDEMIAADNAITSAILDAA